MKHKTTPTYLQWAIGDHYFKDKQGVIKFVGTLLFIFMGVATPGPVLEEYYGGWMPIWPVIGWAISVYGGLAAILIQPYLIYKRLKRINWWGDKKQ